VPNQSGHSYKGRRGRRSRRAGAFSQATYRRPITLHDQHGREWTATVGTKTGMPTGIIQPSFSAPWYPDHQYMKVNPENTSELFIDYESLLLRRRSRLADFHTLALDIARKKGIPLPAKVGEYTDELLGLLPGMPKPVQPVVAAMQGNEYILGLTNVVDERLRRYVQASRDVLLAEAEAMDFRPRSFADAKAENAKTANNTATPIEGAPVFTPAEANAHVVDVDAFDELDAAGTDEEVGAMIEDLGVDLDEEFDAAAVGGRTIAPQKQERAARQAPRRNGSKVARNGTVSRSAAAKQRRAAAKKAGRRPTLADGARPVIAE
jgi:hypothetical protein